jgi:hypothetical protein
LLFLQVERFLLAFSDHLAAVSEPLSTEDAALLFSQLRHVDVESAASRQLVSVMTSLLAKCQKGLFSSREIGLCMFGLSELSDEHSEVRWLMRTVHKRVLKGWVGTKL